MGYRERVVDHFLPRPAMEMVQEYIKPVRDFAKDSMRLVKRCTKPDLKGKSGLCKFCMVICVLSWF